METPMAEMTFSAFLDEARKRDILKEFETYYMGQHEIDPESWPMDLLPQEWWEQFSTYLYGRYP
jgi:hypothetical protein